MNNSAGPQADFLITLLKIQWTLLLEQLAQLDHAVCVSTVPAIIGALARSLSIIGGLLTDEMVSPL